MESKKLCQIDLSEAQPEELGKPVDPIDDGINPCSFLCLITAWREPNASRSVCSQELGLPMLNFVRRNENSLTASMNCGSRGAKV